MQTFDFRKVAVSFNGQLITGYMDGTPISAARDADAFNRHTGADGETSRAANADKGGTVTLTLKQTSAGNDLLSRQHALDELTNGGTGVLNITDGSGRTVLNCAEAWVKKYAEVTMGQEIQGREWVIDCGKLELNVAGN